ncbi:MAG: hypothetical protein ACFFBP_04535 [Promethearchaeota archaeon]
MASFDLREYWIAILFTAIFIFLILLIIYPYYQRFKSLRKEGMSYGEIYKFLRLIFIRSSSISIEETLNDEFQEEKFVSPKNVDPYIFFCSFCNVTSVGYEVLCPICGKRMRQPRFSLMESNLNKNESCLICHDIKCPECNLELNGNESCIQDCPYCESLYHYHCWKITMEKFGKCGHCLEKPPPDFEKLISLEHQKKLNEPELMAKFEAETGKKATWGNRITKNYLKWKEKNYP